MDSSPFLELCLLDDFSKVLIGIHHHPDPVFKDKGLATHREKGEKQKEEDREEKRKVKVDSLPPPNMVLSFFECCPDIPHQFTATQQAREKEVTMSMMLFFHLCGKG